jgi:energy-coupling factor transporter ATP-binding protein EcfA2
MNNPAASNEVIHYYPTFEARETAFRSQVAGLVPPRHEGPRRFWQEFVDIGRRLGRGRFDFSQAVIPANPADSLAYSTPRQELVAMVRRTGAAPGGMPAPDARVLSQYHLGPLLDQPTRTLSGGETARLALAKAHMAVPTVAGLTVASPFNWLSAENRHLFLDLVRHYRDHGRCVFVLALEGEDDLSPLAGRRSGRIGAAETRPVLELALQGVEMRLGFSLGTGRPPVSAGFRDADLRLVSPCLVGGENGSGKSLLAKAVCGAASCRGVIRVGSPEKAGPPRLLFQDVVSQTLFRPFTQLAATPAESFYRSLRRGLPKELSRQCRRAEQLRRTDPPRLLEIKLILAAVRLAQKPRALVLDEPDWGLTRAAAVGFVDSVIGLSHDLAVPVLLISHKPWWDVMAASRLTVTKRAEAAHRTRRLLFQIKRGIT